MHHHRLDTHPDLTGTALTRRRVLALTVSGAVAAVLAACGGNGSTVAPPTVAKGTTVAPVTTNAPSAPAAPAASTAPGGMSTGTTPAGSSAVAGASAAASAAPAMSASSAPGMVDGKLPAPVPGVPDAYTKYPAPFKSVAMPPGKGGKVTAFLSQTLAPPTPRANNRYWQELEKRLNITWEPNLVANGTYDEKFAALIAGGDFPDFVTLVNTAPEQVRAIQQGAFTDLTPFLTGAALKEFPNLALIPPPVWKNLMIKGKLYGVPKTRYIAGDPLVFRGDWLAKLGLAAPKNADELTNLLVTVTKTDFPGANKPYAISSGYSPTHRFCLPFFRQMFRVPHEWRVNSDGSLTAFLETDEFRQTLDYMRKLYGLGVFHPDAPTAQSPQLKDAFAARKIAAYGDTITGMPGQQRNLIKVTPNGSVIGLVPPGFDGGKPTVYNSIGYASYLGIPAKVGKDRERTRELLRVLDYWAAPFGSEEYTFINFGLPDVDYTVTNGVPAKNDTGNAEIADLSYTVNGPFSFFVPDVPGFAQREQQLAVDLIAVGVDNPVLTLFSPTNATKGGELNQLLIDRTIAIVTGREPLTALDQWIKDWRSRGGDTIRKEYQDAMKA